MANELSLFERIARSASSLAVPLAEDVIAESEHPFETRNIHPLLPSVVRALFDDGHFAQATLEAFKFIDREVARLAKQNGAGYKLMMSAFSEDKPILKLTPCESESQKDEQMGFKFIFAGSMSAIRNPRAHEYAVRDSPDECLDHLALASVLLRRLQAAGYNLSSDTRVPIAPE
jgi:uncharacterized protein (TIGR02391 family)